MIVDLTNVRLWSPNARVHWAQAYERKKTLRQLVAMTARSAKMPTTKDQHRVVQLTLYRGKGQKMMDVDNMVAMLKPVLDGLKDARVIVDDSAKWVEVLYRQERDEMPMVGIEVVE